MSTCIPKVIVEKLRSAIKSKKLDIDKLYEMSGKDARNEFAKYVGEEHAKLFNLDYEKARIIAEKKSAADYITYSAKSKFQKLATKGEFSKKLLTSDESRQFASDNLDKQIQKNLTQQAKLSDAIKQATGEDKNNLQFRLNKKQDALERLKVRKEDVTHPQKDKLLKKISSIEGRLPDETYSEIVSAKMGHDITPAQSKYIIDKAIELKGLAKGNETDVGGLTAEYDNARTALDSYIAHLDKNGVGAVIQDLADIGRNNLLIGFSTPVKVLLNYTNFFANKILQRISALSLLGEHADLIKSLEADDKKFMSKTGASRAQFTDINDTSTVLGGHPDVSRNGSFGLSIRDAENYKMPGEIGNGGKIKSGIHYLAKGSHKVAIQWEHVLAFNYVFRRTFYDTLRFEAKSFTKIDNKISTEEAIKDANRVEPMTTVGKALRERAQQKASYITNTDNTLSSDIALGIKNALNTKVWGQSLHIGDLVEPMAKIPADVIQHGIEKSLIGTPRYVMDLLKGRTALQEGLTTEARLEGLVNFHKGLEGLMGIIGTTSLGLLLTSQLKPKDFKTDRYGNTYVHMYGHWINTDLFGRIAPTISGMMFVKQNTSKSIMSDAFSYLHGSALGIKRLPGIGSGIDAVNGLLGKHPSHYLKGFGYSRLLPAGLRDLFENRPTNRVFFGAHGFESDKMVSQDKADIKARKERNKPSTEY